MTRPHAARLDRVRGWLAWCLAAVALFLVPWPPRAVDEFYSRDLYPALQSGLTAVSNLTPVAVIDLMIAAAFAASAYRIAQLALLASRRGLWAAAWEGVRRALRGVGVVAVLFMCAWGCNYRRVPLETAIDAPPDPTTDVASLRLAIADADALAARVHARASGESMDYAAVAARLYPPMNAALTVLKLAPLSRSGRPKFSFFLTPFFTRAGVDGMINPLALESIIHPELLPFERPYVLAHEWAHLAGLADEADASAIGWFACMQGPPALAYSASLYLILESVNALPAAERRQAWASLDADVRTDLDAISRRLERRQPQVQHAAAEVYDRYLKANRVADGTASYSRALTLILNKPLRGALTTYSATRW